MKRIYFAIFVCISILVFLLWGKSTEQRKRIVNRYPVNHRVQETKTQTVEISKPTVSSYRIEVEKQHFQIYKNSLLEDEYRYKELENVDTMLVLNYDKQFLYENGNLIFYADIFPAGCESAEETECLRFLGSVIQEFKKYGGIWKIDLKNRRLTHLFSIPDIDQSSTQIKTFQPILKQDRLKISLVFHFQNQSEREIDYTFDIITGKQLPSE